MSGWWADRVSVPVESHVRAPIDVGPQVVLPEVGRRWGRPSAFTHSQAALERDPGVSVTLPDAAPAEVMRVIRAPLKVTASVHERGFADGARYTVDRLNRMSFGYVELPPKPTTGHPQPTRSVWYDLWFRQHPPSDEDAPT